MPTYDVTRHKGTAYVFYIGPQLVRLVQLASEIFDTELGFMYNTLENILYASFYSNFGDIQAQVIGEDASDQLDRIMRSDVGPNEYAQQLAIVGGLLRAEFVRAGLDIAVRDEDIDDPQIGGIGIHDSGFSLLVEIDTEPVRIGPSVRASGYLIVLDEDGNPVHRPTASSLNADYDSVFIPELPVSYIESNVLADVLNSRYR